MIQEQISILPFPEWLADFDKKCARKDYDSPLKILETRLKPYNPKLFMVFKQEVLRACYHAYWYNLLKKRDHHKKTRKVKIDFIEEHKESLLEATNQIISTLSKYKFLTRVIYQDGKDLLHDEHKIEILAFAPSTSKSMIAGLQVYKRGLESLNSKKTHSAYWEEYYTAGNLRFYERRKNRGQLDVDNVHNIASPYQCLIFELGALFKLWTNPTTQKVFKTAYTFYDFKSQEILMPPRGKGKPYANIIAAFVNQVLEESASSDDINDNLKKKILKSVKLVSWRL